MTDRELEALSAALVAMAKHNVPADVVELLVRGNPQFGIAPGVLMAAINAAIDINTRACFTCPKCGLNSYNPNDIKNSYCGNCHQFMGDR